MTEQEAEKAFNEAKAAFDATVQRLRDAGVGGKELYNHVDYIEADKAKWQASDAWTKTVTEGK